MYLPNLKHCHPKVLDIEGLFPVPLYPHTDYEIPLLQKFTTFNIQQ